MNDFTIFSDSPVTTVVILWANTVSAVEWAETHIEHAQRWGIHGYVVETNFLQPILEGIKTDGLAVGK